MAQMSINRYTDKHNMVHPHNGVLFSHEKERSTDPPAICADLKHMMLRGRYQIEIYALCDSLYTNSPEEVNPDTG